MPNRLASATSPYLRSHADNPVDWFPWGPDAFALATERDVPVLVSIGYSTCHWCHVMARESFGDPVLAEYLNANFVAIKVDREEYPDVDASYLAAASAFTQDLGWPLNVFVTPEGGPFFGGTYWPPAAQGSHPAFRDVLSAVAEAWQHRREGVLANAASIVTALTENAASAPQGGDELVTDFDLLVARLARLEDAANGGFGTAPKFPVAPVLGFLLDRSDAGDAVAGSLATRTVEKMAASTLCDRVDGGFFRYATRPDWTEPHYERMLYDNALLLGAYARVGDTDTANGIARFLLETLRVDGGAFASAQDSESEVDGVRVEGGYYELGPEARARQPRPALDGKVLTGWNGLAIEALAIAGRLSGRPEWIAAAAGAADYVMAHHALPDRLARTSIDGVLSPAPATLEDFGMLASGLLHLAEATGEPHYAVAARELVDACLPDFTVPGGGDPTLVATGLAIETDPSEGAYPSGISALAAAAHRLWLLGAGDQYREAATRALARVAGLAEQRPMAFGAALGVMSALAAPASQLVVVSDEAVSYEAVSDETVSAKTGELAAVARSRFAAGSVAITVTSDQAREFERLGFELFAGRIAQDGRPTAYECREFVCALPVFEAKALRPTP